MRRLKISACIVLLCMMAACSKQQEQPVITQPTRTQLISEKTWHLVSYGYDINENGVIDGNEENIRP